MVECEFYPYKILTGFLLVLIDTWWNVNRARSSSDLALFSVLIDTRWNVNFVHTGGCFFKLSVLIDTWWNVNEAKWIGENSSDTQF